MVGIYTGVNLGLENRSATTTSHFGIRVVGVVGLHETLSHIVQK